MTYRTTDAAHDPSLAYKAQYWRDGFRLAPYDPDAKDADGDGIVQEGTVWERPVGTRWVDEAGREIARGVNSPSDAPNRRIVDADGKPVDYTPRGDVRRGEPNRRQLARERQLGAALQPDAVAPTESAPSTEEPPAPTSALGQLGYPTIAERGYANVVDTVSPPPPKPKKPAKKVAKKATKKAKKDERQWFGSLDARLGRFSRDEQNKMRRSFREKTNMTIEQAVNRSFEILQGASADVRERGATWYARVKDRLDVAAKERNVRVETLAGVLAATSQRMTWYNPNKKTYPNWNVAMAITDLWNENKVIKVTQADIDEYVTAARVRADELRTDIQSLEAVEAPTPKEKAQLRTKRQQLKDAEAKIERGILGLDAGSSISLHDMMLGDAAEGADVAAFFLSDDVRMRTGTAIMPLPLARAVHTLAVDDPDRVLRGPKIRSFWNNLMTGGKGEGITIDVWMARILTGIDGIKLDSGGTREEFFDADGTPMGMLAVYPAFAEVVARITSLWNVEHPDEPYTAAEVQAILWEYAIEQGF